MDDATPQDNFAGDFVSGYISESDEVSWSSLSSIRQHAAARQSKTDHLESEIRSLCATINAATFQLLLLIAEYDREELWAIGGSKSCAHWLNWCCGISLGAAREKVRVARALEQLPAVADAFRQGKLSYSKARAITRIGTLENESYLLGIAQFGSASQLDRMVKHYRGIKGTQARDQERRRAAELSDLRQLEHHWDDDGMLVINARLPGDQGAIVIKALEQALNDLNADRPLPDPVELHKQALEQQALEQNTGVDERVANLDERTSAEGFIPGVFDTEYQQARANRRADALALLAEHYLDISQSPGNIKLGGNSDRFQVSVLVDHPVLSDLQPVLGSDPSDLTSSPRCEIDNEVSLARDTVRRLCCDASLIALHERGGKTLDVGRKTRAISPAMKRALKKRDCGCRFPGCTATRYVEGHHVQHWADGGHTELSNLILLCKHHHRLMHEGGFNVIRTDDEFRFISPGGAVIPAAAPWVTSTRDAAEIVTDAKSTDEPWSWRGDRIDWDDAMEFLCNFDSS